MSQPVLPEPVQRHTLDPHVFLHALELPCWTRDDELARLAGALRVLRQLDLPVIRQFSSGVNGSAWYLGSTDEAALTRAVSRLDGALLHRAVPAAPASVRGTALVVPGLPGRDADLTSLVRAGLSFSLTTLAVPVTEAAAWWSQVEVELDRYHEHGRTPRASEAPRHDRLRRSLQRLSTAAGTGGLWIAVTYAVPEGATTPTELAAGLLAALGAARDDGPGLQACTAPWGLAALHTLTVPQGPDIDAALSPAFPSTLLDDHDLALLCAPPADEVAGCPRRRRAELDRVPATRGPIILGITRDGHPVGVTPGALRAHISAFGATRSGKTNAVMGLLVDLHRQGIPWLVIEPPPKTEYRHLLHAIPELRVFTLGSEIPGRSAPLRLNMLEPPTGVPVSVWADHVKSAMLAGFDLWEPLPQLLAQALDETYRDRRTPADRVAAPGMDWPRLHGASIAGDRVVARAGHDPEVQANLRAALGLRLESLRTPPKGSVLDCAVSLPIEELLAGPTVVEVHLQSPDELALVMGLLFIRIAAHRAAQGSAPEHELRHLLVIEEAHRFLRQEEGSRSGARTAIAELLATIGALGQGVLIADQAPSALVPDVIRNTATKLLFASAERDDIEAAGRSMAATPEQLETVPALRPGEALAFTRGEDAPLFVRTEPHRDALLAQAADDVLVARRAEAWYSSRQQWLRPFPTCAACPAPCTLRAEAASIEFDGHALLAGAAAGRLSAALHEHVVGRTDRADLAYCATAQALDRALGARAGHRPLADALADATARALGLGAADAPDPLITERLRDASPDRGPDPGCRHCPTPCTVRDQAAAIVAESGIDLDVGILGRRPAARDLLDLADEGIDVTVGDDASSTTLRFCVAHHLAAAAGDRRPSTRLAVRTELADTPR